VGAARIRSRDASRFPDAASVAIFAARAERIAFRPMRRRVDSDTRSATKHRSERDHFLLDGFRDNGVRRAKRPVSRRLRAPAAAARRARRRRKSPLAPNVANCQAFRPRDILFARDSPGWATRDWSTPPTRPDGAADAPIVDPTSANGGARRLASAG